ncbi:8796_t:CDS:1, partial [Scutellospora calospora]
GDRHRLPSTCDTVWWDPIGNKCLCNDSTCAYTDTSVPMPNKTSTNNSNTGSDGKSNTNGQKSDASSLLYSSAL